MSERKAINKYYPPDYDPSKVPKAKKSTNPNTNRVRLMLPFSMKCVLCNEYIAARRKFNARKEVTAEKYLEVKIIRFHIKCPRCNSPLVFRTDPKSSGFEPVSGAVRNFVSSKATEPDVPETEDQMLERLEKQERENQEYQEQKQRRKNDRFWRQTTPLAGTTLDAFEEKLIEQQKEQEMHDHLLLLQEKAAKLQRSGRADAAILKAQELLLLKRSVDKFAASKRQKHDVARSTASAAIPKKILINIGNLKKLKNLGSVRLANKNGNSNGSDDTKLPLLSDKDGPAGSPANVCETRQDCGVATNEVSNSSARTTNDTTEKEGQDIGREKQPIPSLSASLGDYSSSDQDD